MVHVYNALFIAIVALFLSVAAQEYMPNGRGAGGGRPRRRNNNRLPAFVGFAASGVVGAFVGSWLQGRRLDALHKKEKEELVKYMRLKEEQSQLRDQQWQTEYQKLYKLYEEIEKEVVERDYEEFKAPDVNNDDMITKSEFNSYVRKYLSTFPEMEEKDFPTFEEFDLNKDGVVSFEEWQRFLYEHKKKEAEKAKQAGAANSQYGELINSLYDQSAHASGFNSLQQKNAVVAQHKATGRM